MGASGRIGAFAASERGECDGPGATPECVLLLVVRHADDAVAAHEVDDRPAGPQEDDLHGRVVAFAGVGGRGGAGREIREGEEAGGPGRHSRLRTIQRMCCLCVQTRTDTRTLTHARKHARTHARMHAHARTRTHACMHARTHAHTEARARTHAHARMHARTHTHTHTHRGARPAHSETKWVKRSR